MTDSDDKKVTFKFAPGFFEALDEEFSPEEQQQIMDALSEMMENPESLFENSVSIDELSGEERADVLDRIGLTEQDLEDMDVSDINKGNDTIH